MIELCFVEQRASTAIRAAHAALGRGRVNWPDDNSLGDENIAIDAGRSAAERRTRRSGRSKLSPANESYMGPKFKSGSARWWQRGLDGDDWMGHALQDHGHDMHYSTMDYFGTMGRQSPYITPSQAPYAARQDSLRLHDVEHDVRRPLSAQSKRRSRPSSAHTSFSTERTSSKARIGPQPHRLLSSLLRVVAAPRLPATADRCLPVH